MVRYGTEEYGMGWHISAVHIKVRYLLNVAVNRVVHVHPQFFNADQDYTLLRIRDVYPGFKIFTQIRIKIVDLMKKIHVATNICFRANIRLRFSHTCKYLLQNIRLEANICKSLSEFHIQVNIHFPLVEDPRSGKNVSRIRIHGVKKALDPRSRSASLGFLFIYFIYIF